MNFTFAFPAAIVTFSDTRNGWTVGMFPAARRSGLPVLELPALGRISLGRISRHLTGLGAWGWSSHRLQRHGRRSCYGKAVHDRAERLALVLEAINLRHSSLRVTRQPAGPSLPETRAIIAGEALHLGFCQPRSNHAHPRINVIAPFARRIELELLDDVFVPLFGEHRRLDRPAGARAMA